ncbi:hypothetical protein TI05_01580 [Achromatium sp. WMS3]|nr:hypothetical protein TI05_01580 [Achromatium sp. WMS3]
MIGIGNTDKRFKEIEDKVNNGYKLPSTHTADQIRYAWSINLKDNAGHKGYPVLAIQDIGGEIWSHLADRRHQRLLPDEIKRYLNHDGDLLMIVDGARVAMDLGIKVDDAWDPGVHGDKGHADRIIIQNIYNYFGINNIKKMRLAIVITKADCLSVSLQTLNDLTPVDDYQQRVKELLIEVAQVPCNQIPQQVLQDLLEYAWRKELVHLGTKFSKFRVFASSSFGFRPTRDDINASNKLTTPIMPIGIIEPLFWLLNIPLKPTETIMNTASEEFWIAEETT